MDRRWRLVWVLLLCVLLPLRGALAASMACGGLTLPPPGLAAPAALAEPTSEPEPHEACPHGHAAGPAPMSDRAGVERRTPGIGPVALSTAVDADTNAHPDGHAATLDTSAKTLAETVAETPDTGWQHPSCHLCVAGCLWLPLPATAADWRPEPAARGVHFPPPALPAIAWVADGPDRPPKG